MLLNMKENKNFAQSKLNVMTAEAPIDCTWSWPKRFDEQELMSSKELTPLTASQAQQEI